MSKEVRRSFFAKKEPKKLSLTAGFGEGVPEPTLTKVFCFFFSKKKSLLPSYALNLISIAGRVALAA